MTETVLIAENREVLQIKVVGESFQVDLMSQALRVRNAEELTLPVEEVHPGETIIIRPREKTPLDGRVLSGSSAVDEAPITGEPVPVVKEKRAEVFAGTLNQRGFWRWK